LICIKPLVTHSFKLDDIEAAYELLAHQRDAVMKVAIPLEQQHPQTGSRRSAGAVSNAQSESRPLEEMASPGSGYR